MKKLYFLIFTLFVLGACSPHRGIKNTANQQEFSQTGLSFENAILVEAKTETSGVKWEYNWLEENYPGYKMIQQSLNYKDSTPYDIISIKTADKGKKDVYFNISKFFGKY